jgi:diguanylate cyclase (GGDEF)-like protein
VSSDQLTYVLIALIVTGIAILLLLVGALAARRGRGEPRPVAPAARDAAFPEPALAAPPYVPAPVAAMAQPSPTTVQAMAPEPAPVAPVAPIEPAAPAEPATPAVIEPDEATEPPPEPSPAAEAGQAQADVEGVSDEAAVVTAADLAAAARRVHDPREEEIIQGFLSITPRRRDVVAAEGTRGPSISVPAPVVEEGEETEVRDAMPADPYLDDATGLDSRSAWDRVLAEENARYVRYRRPVGVVVAELDGLARFDGQFGSDASRRILAAVGGAMRRSARRTDRVAHVGAGRFLVLMPETDEIQAINYVERVRSECERWLVAGAVAMHLSMGWASPSAVGELDTALRTAEERMYAERRRAGRGVGSSDPTR